MIYDPWCVETLQCYLEDRRSSKIMKVVVSQEEWQRRVIILNEIVVVVFPLPLQ